MVRGEGGVTGVWCLVCVEGVDRLLAMGTGVGCGEAEVRRSGQVDGHGERSMGVWVGVAMVRGVWVCGCG